MDESKLIVIMKGVMGSRCHNLDTPESDTDIRGVGVMDELDYHLGLKRFDRPIVKEKGEQDLVIWGLRQFIHLALKGNTNTWNLLWCRHEAFTELNELGRTLRMYRRAFLSMRMRKVLKGYYIQEYKEATGAKTGRLGDKRKQAIEKYGYSIKNASHCVRLLHTGTVLFTTGEYPVWFDGPEREMMMNVKLGKLSLDEFNEVYDEMLSQFDTAAKDGVLPEEPETEVVMEIVRDFLCERIDAIRAE